MSESFPELIIRCHADLVDALAAVKNHLGLSNETLEAVAGLAKGHADKIIGRTRSKSVGRVSFDLLLGALGIELVVRPDPAAAAKVATRWERRNEKQIRNHQRLSQELLARAAQELGRRGAIAAARARRQAQRRNGRHNGNGHAATNSR